MTTPAATLIGFGHVARNAYLPALAAGGARIRVVDTSPEARDDAERLGLEALRELPAAGDDDRAFILTPIPSHLALARAAIEQGYHVLVEKPAAPDAFHWQELCAQARGAGRAVVAAPFTASGWCADAIRALIQEGHLGQIARITVDFAKSGPYENGLVAERRSWFLGSDAGPARDFAPYPLTLLIALFGSPDEVRWAVGGGPQHAHALTAHFIVNGSPVRLAAEFRYAEPTGRPPLAITGTMGEIIADSELVDGPLLKSPVPPRIPAPGARRSKYQVALAEFDRLARDERALHAHQSLVGKVIHVLERIN